MFLLSLSSCFKLQRFPTAFRIKSNLLAWRFRASKIWPLPIFSCVKFHCEAGLRTGFLSQGTRLVLYAFVSSKCCHIRASKFYLVPPFKTWSIKDVKSIAALNPPLLELSTVARQVLFPKCIFTISASGPLLMLQPCLDALLFSRPALLQEPLPSWSLLDFFRLLFNMISFEISQILLSVSITMYSLR